MSQEESNYSRSNAQERAQGLSEVFGTIRYGDLFEALLYDTKRYVSLGLEQPPTTRSQRLWSSSS